MIFSYPLFEMPIVGIYLIIMAFMFGAIFASFITCTAWRVVRGEDWKLGHSHCDTCGHELSTADLFPVISYIALKGKCRYCGSKVPPMGSYFRDHIGIGFRWDAGASWCYRCYSHSKFGARSIAPWIVSCRLGFGRDS